MEHVVAGRTPEVRTVPEVFDEMRQIVPAGMSQQELDQSPETVARLRDTTLELLRVHGDQALSEYHRYIGTEKRSLEFSPEAEEALAEMFKGKRVLVTGATGVIADPLLKLLQKYKPEQIFGISRDVRKPGVDYEPVDGIKYRTCDVRNKDELRHVFAEAQPDVVIHLAAERSPGRAEEEPERTIETNLFGTENVLEVMEEFAQTRESREMPRYIHASTGKAVRPYTPDVYCGTKKAAELLIARFASRMAEKGKTFLASAGRFTHNVDKSIVINAFNKALDTNAAISMHKPEDVFYVESAMESAQLLLLGALEAKEGELTVSAINDLGFPITLFDVALGAIADKVGGAEAYAKLENPPYLYIHGKPKGYEDVPYPSMYHPAISDGVSPLVSAIDGSAEPAKNSLHPEDDEVFQLDKFGITFDPKASTGFNTQLEFLRAAIPRYRGRSGYLLRDTLQSVSWAGLEARLATTPLGPLTTMAQFVSNDRRTSALNKLPEHHAVDAMIRRVAGMRQAVARAFGNAAAKASVTLS